MRSGGFSGNVVVDVLGKGTVSMKDLSVGEQVGTTNRNSIYAFAQLDETKEADFLQIHTFTKNNRLPLEVTACHLVFLYNRKNPVRADSIRIGNRNTRQIAGRQ